MNVSTRELRADGKSKGRYLLAAAAIVASLGFFPASSLALSTGVTNATMKTTGGGCKSCHGATEGGNLASVTITGPATLDPGQTATYTITATQVTPNTALKLGVNIAASDDPLPLSVPGGQALVAFNSELKHTNEAGTLATSFYQFNYTMPSSAASGTTHTIYAVAAIGPGVNSGTPPASTGWRHAPNFTVTANIAPASSLTPSSIEGTSAAFAWSGGGPEYRLVYKPGATPPASPTDGTQLDIGAVTSTVVTGLTISTQYSFRLYSRTAGGSPIFSGTGPTATITTTDGTPQDPARLSNISTRMQVLTGNDVLIGGFVVGGSSNKTVVVRARGPSLTPFGIPNALANPQLQLVRSSDQQQIAFNDDWQSASNAAQITSSGFAPSNSLEAAILVSLPPGAYTAIVTGVGNGTGVGIVEVFEVDAPTIPLTNISTRGQVLTGNDVMIGGFIVSGSGPQTVVVRARGPSLTPFGIPNALANPQLQLVRSSDQSQVAFNDDWQSASNAAQITSSGFAPSNNLESAILISLQPGAYTAIVTGVGGGTGVGIFEVFVTP